MTLEELKAKWDSEIAERAQENDQYYQMRVLEQAGYEFLPGEIVKRNGVLVQRGLPLWKSVQVCYANYRCQNA